MEQCAGHQKDGTLTRLRLEAVSRSIAVLAGRGFFLAFSLSFFLSLSLSLFLFLSWKAVQDILILLFVTKKSLLGDYQRKDNWMKNRISFDQSYLFVLWSTFDASFEYI